jgi:ElaB/YqjD/DUF883 family membrane-anchored ribosome-binding protein
MSVNNSKKLEKTKKELQEEIDKIENLLDGSLEKVKTDISSFDPRKIVRKNPLPSVGIAVVAGLLLGISTSSKKGEKSPRKGEDLGSAFWHEIKRVAVRQIVSRTSAYIEQFLDEL